MWWFLISLLFVCLFVYWLVGWLVKLDIVLRWESTYWFVEMVWFVCNEELFLYIMFEWTFVNYSFIEWIRSLNSLLVIKKSIVFFLSLFILIPQSFAYLHLSISSQEQKVRRKMLEPDSECNEKKMFILFD